MKLTALSSGDFCTILPSEYPDIIRLTGFIALIAFICILITLAVIFYNRVAKKKAREISAEADEAILNELNEHILLYNSVSDIPEAELNETVTNLNELKNRNKVFRKSMVRLLLYFQANLTGAIARIISSAFSRLKLREFTMRKLKSPMWFIKTQGLTEVQEMQDGHSLPEVYKLAKDSNQDVRVAAYTVLLKLKAIDCFDFLDDEKEELSEWHQIVLEDAISKTPGLDVPDFRTYLSSKNRSIVLLSIKLIVDFLQFNAVAKLLSILDSEDDYLRNQVIQALGQLNALNSEERLRERYEEEPVKNKVAILIALGKIGSGESIDFIRQKFLQAENFQIMKGAAAAIIAHPEALKAKVLNSLSDINDDQEAVLKHFSEPMNMYGIV